MIGDYAFSACGSLKSINIPSSVTTLGTYFIGDAVTDIYIDKEYGLIVGEPWGAENAAIHWNTQPLPLTDITMDPVHQVCPKKGSAIIRVDPVPYNASCKNDIKRIFVEPDIGTIAFSNNWNRRAVFRPTATSGTAVVKFELNDGRIIVPRDGSTGENNYIGIM